MWNYCFWHFLESIYDYLVGEHFPHFNPSLLSKAINCDGKYQNGEKSCSCYAYSMCVEANHYTLGKSRLMQKKCHI